MSTGPLRYFRSDELPAWVETVTVNGTTYDYSSGWTFSVTLTDAGGTVGLTKTTNITGAVSGVITVAWATNELDLAEGTYRAVLVASRTSDSAQHTLERTLQIVSR